MTRWRDVPYAVIDLETTGTDQRVHEILSVGIVPIDDGRVVVGRMYYRAVRPTREPESDSVVVHGIRPVDATSGLDPSVVAREVEDEIRGRVLVAHVAQMECGFLNRWLPDTYVRPRDVIDTDVLSRLVIARRGGPLVAGHIRLGAAVEHFGLPEHRRHHALGDALTTAQLFLATASWIRPDGAAKLADLRRAAWRLRRAGGEAAVRRVLRVRGVP